MRNEVLNVVSGREAHSLPLVICQDMHISPQHASATQFLQSRKLLISLAVPVHLPRHCSSHHPAEQHSRDAVGPQQTHQHPSSPCSGMYSTTDAWSFQDSAPQPPQHSMQGGGGAATAAGRSRVTERYAHGQQHSQQSTRRHASHSLCLRSCSCMSWLLHSDLLAWGCSTRTPQQ